VKHKDKGKVEEKTLTPRLELRVGAMVGVTVWPRLLDVWLVLVDGGHVIRINPFALCVLYVRGYLIYI